MNSEELSAAKLRQAELIKSLVASIGGTPEKFLLKSFESITLPHTAISARGLLAIIMYQTVKKVLLKSVEGLSIDHFAEQLAELIIAEHDQVQANLAADPAKRAVVEAMVANAMKRGGLDG